MIRPFGGRNEAPAGGPFPLRDRGFLRVHRAEAMRLFVYWDPTDGIEYVGTLSGTERRAG
jgi:hypothetical protein